MKKFSIILLLVFCVLSSQITLAQIDSSSPKKEKTSKKDKKNKEKAPKVKKEKPAKSSSSTGSNGNLGPVFDGASVSVSAGYSVYHGDLGDYMFFPRPKQFSTYLSGAYKVSIARDIKWGLGAQFHFNKGSLIGTRKTGKYSSTVSFRNHFEDISLSVRYNLKDVLFKGDSSRFYIYAKAGFGSMWYRSQLYDTETLNTKDYEGYIEVDNTQGLAQKTLSDKTKKAQTYIIPYGITVGYRVNYKFDLFLDITQSNTFTDRLDAWSRSWTAKDKYNYIGIGLTYNFNRDPEKDAPKKCIKKVQATADNNIEDTSSDNSSTDDIRKSIFAKKGKHKKDKDDDLLNIRLKLFETQLKLFEMQYLIGQ